MADVDLQPDGETRSNAPGVEQLRFPQFGIIHLLLWTAIAALLLKVLLAMRQGSVQELGAARVQELGAVRHWMYLAAQSLYAITLAGTLVGSGVLLKKRCNDKFRRLQPGHWLVLSSSLSGVLTLGVWLLFRLTAFRGGPTVWVTTLGVAAMSAVMASFYVLGVLLLRDARRWKAVMVAAAVGDASAAALYAAFAAAVALQSKFDFVLHLLSWASLTAMVWSVALLVMLLVVLALDLPRRRSRDWLHWLGVAAFGFLSAWPLVSRFVEMFVFRVR